jgi:uncharacterized protein (DUF1499 family)
MLRRHIMDQPTSRLALWSRRMSLFSLLATVLAIIILRSGFLEIWPALTTFGGALALAVVALLLALGAFVVIWREGLQGMGYALVAIAIAGGLLAYPTYLVAKSYKLPRIYDITSDLVDPPRYEALARIRPRDANPILYKGREFADLQRAGYPDIEPIEAEATVQIAYSAALAIVTKRRWRVVEARPPLPPRREGRIEAVARTPIMGFADDVVVRIRADGEGSRVDARSSSRYGRFDFGANAARVRALLEEIEDAIDNQKPEQPASPVAKKGKAAPKGSQPAAKR